jgi:hypothetical protein
VADRVSEYFRRIRQKAEQQQREVERERNEAAENARVEQIISAVNRLEQELDRQGDEKHPKAKSERHWKIAEVLGLWAAAAVGVFAIYVASHDSVEQYGIMKRQQIIMQGQLDEMRTASALTRAQMRANVTISSFTPILAANGDWQIHSIWRNQGPTNADQFQQWSSFTVDAPDIPEDFDFSKPTKAIIEHHTMTLAGGDHVAGEPVAIVAGNIQIITAGKATLYLWGDASYRDIFFPTTPIHHTHYCSKVVIPDAKNPGTATFDAYRPDCNFAD